MIVSHAVLPESVATPPSTDTLSGAVETWLEHNVAVTKAYEGGASSVRDHLQVINGPDEFRS